MTLRQVLQSVNLRLSCFNVLMQRKAQRFPTAANIQQRTEIQISAEGWGRGGRGGEDQ